MMQLGGADASADRNLGVEVDPASASPPGSRLVAVGVVLW
jgi:hypothetical protein